LTTLAIESDDNIARVTLSRPDRRNAIDGRMVAELSEAFGKLSQEPFLRGIVLAGAGPVFCAGADIQWMQSASPVSEARARDDAHQLTSMFRAIDECPCPVIARVQGPAFGGGLGLMAVCDVVVAAEDATFSLSETRLGLIPAVIAPFLLRKAGESFLRRYCLTGETFGASTAQRFNLIHDVVPQSDLDDRITDLTEAIMRLAPRATSGSKSLLHRMLPLSDGDRRDLCAEANASARCAPEAAEGLRAFVEKRLPSWAKPGEQKGEQEALKSEHVSARRT
jgi:methylglutaconyl-CoA hydratase